MSDRLWRLALNVPKSAVEAFEMILGGGAWAISSFEIPGSAEWTVEVLLDREPKLEMVERSIVSTAALLGMEPPTPMIEPVDDDDWVTKALQQHPPVRAGRIFVHGSHAAKRIPSGVLPILIDAAQAFGTGHHESTRGCLLALDRLSRQGRRRRGKRVLDMGCGSGVLAIAMWKLWRARPLAVDVDQRAVEETMRNSKRNGCGARLRPLLARGFRGRRVMRGPRFEVITANILARPLCSMSTPLTRRLKRGGRAILSGLLSEQAPAVEAYYRVRGMAIERRINLSGWTTLVLKK